MKKVLIIFAQGAEAAATLQRLKAEPIEGEFGEIWGEGRIPSLYQFHKGLIAISSVGLHAAQMAVVRHGSECEEIWNLGLAGALCDHYQIGSLLSISRVGKYLPVDRQILDPPTRDCVDFTLPTFFTKEEACKLISSDFPLHDVQQRQQLGKIWDLVDMEGYGIAFAATHLEKKWRIWKIVSDFASPGGRELIRKHKTQLSEIIADVLVEKLIVTHL